MHYARARMLAIWMGVVATASGCHAYDETLLRSESTQARRAPASGERVADAAAASDASSVSRAADADDDRPDSGAALDSGVKRDATGFESDATTRDAMPAEASAGAGGVGAAAVGGSTSAGVGGASGQASVGTTGGMPVVAVPCTDAGGRVWASNGHCYFPLSVMNSWFVSRDRCRELGAHLVSIASADEQVFVNSLIGTTPRWTGLSRFGAPAFSWVDGESMTYENWEEGAPKQMSEAAVAVRSDTFLWFDDAVSQAHAALCERQ